MIVENEGVVGSVGELLSKLRERRLSDTLHYHLRWWFRGQSSAEWDLRPGVYRDGFAEDEQARLMKERHLAQDFRVESAGIRSGRETDEELYFLQQHYRLPTRLLDWTSSPLAALYFAVTGHVGVDGKLFLMDAYQLTPFSDEPSSSRGIATSRDPRFKKALQPIVQWKDVNNFPDFIIAVRPDHFDRRIGLQKSCFTFHDADHPSLNDTHNRTLCEFRIPFAAKNTIKADLFLLGVDGGSIYGDLEGLAERLKWAYRVDR
jgi:hypothetical protein